MARDLESLQGTWHLVSLAVDGQTMAGGGARIEVSGERFTTTGMGGDYSGTVSINQKSKPKSFDLHFEDGPEKGNTNFGIYELTGDTWRLCLSTRGSVRPKEFAAPAGTGIALESLQRAPVAEVSAAPLSSGTTSSAASGAPEGDSAPEIAGEWAPVSLVRDGEALPPSMLKYGRRIATANEVTVKFGPQVVLKAKYAVDRGKTPMTMDYVLADGNSQFGIWKVEGAQVTTCFGAPGQPRPAEFASTKGDGRTLTVWTPA